MTHMVFTADGKLTDEAAQASQICGIDPLDLNSQPCQDVWKEKAR